jgi:hypothetical protein
MTLRTVAVLATLTLAVLLAGCAATVQQPAGEQPKIEIPAAAAGRLVVVVKGSDRAIASDDWEALRGAWRVALKAAADEAGVAFDWRESEASVPSGNGTVAVIRVNDYRYVSTGARYGLGVLTGNAFIDAEVTYRDARNGRPIGRRSYSTMSSAWQGIFSAMTSKQLEALSKEIVAPVAGRAPS